MFFASLQNLAQTQHLKKKLNEIMRKEPWQVELSLLSDLVSCFNAHFNLISLPHPFPCYYPLHAYFSIYIWHDLYFLMSAMFFHGIWHTCMCCM